MDLLDRPLSIQTFEQYLRRRAPLRRTPIDYVSDVRQFAAFCGTAWREVTMHDIDAFVDQQRQAGRSPATIKRRVAALKVFFDFLAEESGDLAWPNPVRAKRHAVSRRSACRVICGMRTWLRCGRSSASRAIGPGLC